MARFGSTLALLALVASVFVGFGTAWGAGASAGDPSGAVGQGTSGADWAAGAQAANPAWNVSDKISPGMSQILGQALIDFGGYTPQGGCPSAAANQAWNALADAANAGPLEAFLDAIKGALKGIKQVATLGADPSAAADMLEAGALVDKAVEQAKDMAKDKAQDYLKDKVREAWRGKPIEVLKRTSSRGGCDVVLIAIWDRASESYEITIYGDCHCQLMPTWGGGGSIMLKTFAVQLKGRVTPQITNDGVLVLNVGYPKITVSANCNCAAGGGRTAAPPAGGGGAVQPPGGGGGGTPPPKHDAAFWRNLTTKCPACQAIVDAIHAAQAARDGMDSEFRDAKGEYDAAVNRGNKDEIAAAKDAMDALTAREAGLIRLEEDLLAKLRACEKEKCPDKASTGVSCPPRDGETAMIVGPNNKVGSGARARQQALSTATGLIGGLLGGGGGGGGGESDEPPVSHCRVKDADMTLFADPASGISLRVAARQTGDTVTVFAKIAQSPDQGTFETAFLQDPQGARLAPADADICDLWGQWSLSVSWTRTTYANGQMVSRESGGWSRSGEFSVPGVSQSGEPGGLWRALGFSNASHGARAVALQFKGAGAATSQPVDLVVHVTRPAADPVTTLPFLLQMTRSGQGFDFQRVEHTAASAACAQAANDDATLAACPQAASGR